MKRKNMLIFVFIGLLAGGCMMNSSSAPGQASGGLIAVSPEGTPLPPQVDSTKLPANTSEQKVGNLNVQLALSPYPPVGFQQTNLDVRLTDENGQAITDPTVTLDLTMPGMPMPQNTLKANYTDQGVYHATGRFTMRDLWRIEVIIQRDGKKQSAFFEVVI
jgi:hypothetical protein